MDLLKDFLVRKALPWDTALKMSKIWKSTLSRNLKLGFFKATMEAVLLHKAARWTTTNNWNDP